METGDFVEPTAVPGITGARLWLLGLMLVFSSAWVMRRFERAR
jgi:hypothetical protein